MPGQQFIGRLLHHVLPSGFKRMCHYGLLAPVPDPQRSTYRTQFGVQTTGATSICVRSVKPYSLKELKQVADCIGSLPGEVKTIEQERLRWGD